jgi:NAD(P)-dependent dehydrogenase (short-subunit alcohol dehydrogenase family)
MTSNGFPEFDGKIAIVTGAASGIGEEMARQLCASGATVVAADIDGERLARVAPSIAAQGGRLELMSVDVSEIGALRELIDGTAAKHGRIDYMINNAGIAGRGGEVRDLQPQDWEKIVGVNLFPVIHGSSFAYAHMIKQGSGHIINMASAAGLLGTPCLSAYGTTKAAVVEFSRDLRVEAEALGVRVTVLCPGFVESRIFENADLGESTAEEMRAALPVKFVPTDRAVQKMLEGVLANRAIVVLPGYVQVLWFLRRRFPVLLDRIVGGKTLAATRGKRRAD